MKIIFVAGIAAALLAAAGPLAAARPISPAGQADAASAKVEADASAASVQADASSASVELDEKLGDTVALDAAFTDMDGKPVEIKNLLGRPTVLTLVYYRCPGICSPLLHSLSDVVARTALTPGRDYGLVTVSFDAREGPDLSKRAYQELVKPPIPPGSWAFMTGDARNIRRLADSVGFRFKSDPKTGEFVHPTTVIVLAKDGKIIRYFNGLEILPADLKMAVLDASSGKVLHVFHRLQRFCYAYDAGSRGYVLKINRVIFLGTVAFVVLFGLLVLARGRRRRRGTGGAAA